MTLFLWESGGLDGASSPTHRQGATLMLWPRFAALPSHVRIEEDLVPFLE